VLFGDGTAAHPNAGLLIGNGYTWTTQTCPTGSCAGGKGGAADDGSTVSITQANTPVTIGSFGTVTVIGLADLAQAGATENAAYVEDHDNYYDVILSGDPAAIDRLRSVRMPSSGAYSPVYNPGGPGNDPTAPGAAPGPFTVPSTDHSIAITNDLGGDGLATFVEVDGAVQRDPVTGQPIGTYLGIALQDIATGQRINAYRDPQGRLFYASFNPEPGVAAPVPAL
jgi:hypothetical protein